MPSVTTQTDLEGIMLSKTNETDADEYHMISLTCRVQKTKQTKKQAKTKLTDNRERTCGRGGEMGEGAKSYKGSHGHVRCRLVTTINSAVLHS